VKILILTQYFWPEGFRINDLCTELVKRGHTVTVLTGKPNYPDGVVYPEFANNTGQFGQFSGADIVRVPMIARGQGSSLQLLLNYFSFAISASLIGCCKLRNFTFDVIFVYEPSPITVGLPAIFLRKAKKIPVVFWALDLWPETLEAVGVVKSKLILGLIGKLVSIIYNRCDLVLGQSRAFCDAIAIYCDDAEKIRYFPSWAENIFADSSTLHKVASMNRHAGVFKVLFAGNIGEAQDFPAIVDAAERLKKQQSNVKLFIVGDGRVLPWLKQQVEDKALHDTIVLLGRHPLESMPSFYESADALLVSLKQSHIFSMTIPGKLQSYLMAKKPILGMLDGEGARVIKESRAGYVCDSGDSQTLAMNIMKMSDLNEAERQDLGHNARQYVHQEFDRDTLISQLEQWFLQVSSNGLKG
jgi:colanic acid biosynthesis glycosyl transferase WcaI